MRSGVWGLARRAVSGVPALLTLAALAALGYWGWASDWQLPPLADLLGEPAAAREGAPEPGVKVVEAPPGPDAGPDDPSPGLMRVEFPSADAVARAGIQVAAVQAKDLARVVTAPGMVDYEPGLYARLSSRASGIVWRVLKEIGEPIHKGEVLALIDSADVGQVKADFLQDLVQVKARATTLQRLEGLGQQGATSERALLDAQTALREARIRLFKDQQALLNLGLPVRLEEMEKLPDDQLARRLRLIGLPKVIADALDPETLTANLLPLTAPFDGQVVERNAATGEVVHLTQPKILFVVADVRRLHIDLDVNPEDMADVRLGQPVAFRSDGGGPEVTGQVSHISPEVNEKTRRVRVHAQVANEDQRLRPNAFGTGRIVVGNRPGALVVPSEAVQADGPASLVFVRVSDTSFEARPVRLGLRQGDLVEVIGVREGEEVVTTGSFLLKSELRKDRIAGGDD
jgi:cobalt-zinc-cadmium efflux system membrane fusion protein